MGNYTDLALALGLLVALALLLMHVGAKRDKNKPKF